MKLIKSKKKLENYLNHGNLNEANALIILTILTSMARSIGRVETYPAWLATVNGRIDAHWSGVLHWLDFIQRPKNKSETGVKQVSDPRFLFIKKMDVNGGQIKSVRVPFFTWSATSMTPEQKIAYHLNRMLDLLEHDPRTWDQRAEGVKVTP